MANAVTTPPRKLVKLPPRPPEKSFHRFRKRIHLLCFLIFCALPFLNVMRFDIPRQRFYFAGYELWINEFGIMFFTLMFLLFVIVAAAMLYGRIYCSYACPQMIFSEASLSVEDWLKRRVTKLVPKWSVKSRNFISRSLFYAALGLASVFLAFAFICYFVEPRDLLARLLRFDLVTAGGIAGAVTTLITFLDFTFVREKFCTTVCPYGYLQGMLCDKNSLLVQYRDSEHLCIECRKCVRVCHMGIDIRKSPFQIECVHCGECIDACDHIMAKIGRPNLIHYTWGEQGEELGGGDAPWYRKIGLRDAKRVVVLGVILFYASGLFVALSMRRSVLVQLSPDRTVLYKLGPDGKVLNHFRLTVANRGHGDGSVRLSIEGLPGAHLVLDPNPLPVKPGETIQREFDIAAGEGGVRPSPGVNHFRFSIDATPENSSDKLDMTFIMPAK